MQKIPVRFFFFPQDFPVSIKHLPDGNPLISQLVNLESLIFFKVLKINKTKLCRATSVRLCKNYPTDPVNFSIWGMTNLYWTWCILVALMALLLLT